MGRIERIEEIERGWREAALIGTAQRVEHREMAGYRTGLGRERPSAEVNIIFFSL
jgi:ferritin-like metal-binding protein YciE